MIPPPAAPLSLTPFLSPPSSHPATLPLPHLTRPSSLRTRSAQRRKQRAVSSRSPGGHRRLAAQQQQQQQGGGGGGGGVGPRAAKWRSPDFGIEEGSRQGDHSPDFRRRRLTLSSVAAEDLTKLASMADELDAGDW